MELSTSMIPGWLIGLGWVFFVSIAFFACCSIKLIELKESNQLIHRLGVAVLAVSILWLMGVQLSSSITIHLLGVTVLTLVLGWPYALFIVVLVQLVLLVVGRQELAAIGYNSVVTGFIPVLVTQCWYQLIERFKPDNVFIYIFIIGFCGALLSNLTVIAVVTLTLWITADTTAFEAFVAVLAYTPLLLFSEGVINGMLISAFVVFAPDLVVTFNQRRYLQR